MSKYPGYKKDLSYRSYTPSIRWLNIEDDRFEIIENYINNDKNRLASIYYLKEGKRHREDGPAVYIYFQANDHF